jgi:hypothetical protein
MRKLTSSDLKELNLLTLEQVVERWLDSSLEKTK